MITFRKKFVPTDLIPTAVEHLTKEGIGYKPISGKEADKVSKVNAKAMVLVRFSTTPTGSYEITLKDKELYNYTQKLLRDILQLRLTKVDPVTREVTAEADHLGVILDVIEVLGMKYDLSVVVKK